MKPKSLLLHPRYDFVVTHFTYGPVASLIIVGGLLHGRYVHSGDQRKRVKKEPPDPTLISSGHGWRSIGRDEAMPRARNVLYRPRYEKRVVEWKPLHNEDKPLT